MPDKTKPSGYYTTAELKAQKASTSKENVPSAFAAPTMSGKPLGPSRPEPIKIEETYFSTAKANKPSASRSKVEKVSTPAMKGIGSKQIDSPTPFRTEQQGNLKAMANNFNKPSVENKTKANRIANRAAKTRSKGEAALEAGNLKKSRRMAKRYDRNTSRLKKS